MSDLERTPEQLIAMSDEDLVRWTARVIYDSALMSRFRCRYRNGVDPAKADHERECLTHETNRLTSLAYAEAARRHPKAPLYVRAYNQVVRGEGHDQMARPEDWTT
jgi:hypothetical protein